MPPRDQELGRLQADMAEAQRQRDKLFTMAEQQISLLHEIREELRVSNIRTTARVEALDGRLTKIEPTIEGLEQIRQRGWGIVVSIIVIVSLLTGGVMSAGAAALRKFGIDI